MADSITTLFSDIVPTAAQRQQQELSRGMLLAENLQTPGFAAALNQPTRSRAIRQAAGGLFGLDTRTPIEREREENQALFQRASTEAQQRFPNDRTAQLNYLADQLQNAGKLVEAQKARALAQESQLQGAKIGAEQALATQRQATAALRGEEIATAQQTRPFEILNLSLESQKLAQELEQGPRGDVGKVNPQDYTPDSLQKFATSGVFSDLVRVDRPEDDNRTNAEKDLDRWLQLIEEGKDSAALAFGRKTGLIPDLSSKLEGDYLDSSRAAREASASALRYNELANQIIQAGDAFGGGTQTTWIEGYKELTGNTDAISSLRTRFKAVRGSAAVQNLPPGAASDADVALALQGVPPENANATTVASFLRGLAKLEVEVSKYNQAKLKYLDDNRSIVGFESSYADSRRQEAQPQTRTTAGGVTYTIVGE